MARLAGSTNKPHGDGNCRKDKLVLPHARAGTAETSTSPAKGLRSPAKSAVKRTTTTLGEDITARARQQRSLKLAHVDSLLLHPVAENTQAATSPLKPGQTEAGGRAPPARKAKAQASLRFYKHDLETSDDDGVASDWQGSHLSSEDEEASDDERFGFSPTKNASDAKHLKFQNLPVFRRPLGSLQFESPRRNALPLLEPRPRNNATISALGRPSSPSDGEPFATIRLYVDACLPSGGDLAD